VAKVHREVRRFRGQAIDVVLIGQAGHDEVVGTLGQAEGVRLVERASDVRELQVADPGRIACVTQTTLGPADLEPVMTALRRRFPAMTEPPTADVCFATRNRQAAIARLAREVDVVIVVGDPTSANSRHLRDVARAAATPAYLIATVAELEDEWLGQAKVVGVSAGASTPEDLVVEVVDRLCRDGAVLERPAYLDERMSFRLPRQVAPTVRPEPVEAPHRVVDRRDLDAGPAGPPGERLERRRAHDRGGRLRGGVDPGLGQAPQHAGGRDVHSSESVVRFVGLSPRASPRTSPIAA
jgi:4-hydroxy-3-methylbut-2-enyl diphosphate reductase